MLMMMATTLTHPGDGLPHPHSSLVPRGEAYDRYYRQHHHQNTCTAPTTSRLHQSGRPGGDLGQDPPLLPH